MTDINKSKQQHNKKLTKAPQKQTNVVNSSNNANTAYEIRDKKKISKNQPHFLGHRARLREKCYKSPSNLPDYEILEIILFWAIPRKDTKALAKKLISTFGSLSSILHTDQDKLLSIDGITKNIHLNFIVIRELLARILKSKFINKHVLTSWKDLIEYLQNTMGDITNENFRVIFLNKKNIIISDELQSSGTIDQTTIYPRQVVKRALFHEATAIILVHNHPSGNPQPSKADIIITKEVQQACATFDIILHDHVIICKNKFFSFKSKNLL